MADEPTATRLEGADNVWGALTPVSNVPAVVGTDPRVELDGEALVLASRNSFPVVAQQKRRRDNLGVAAGGAIALVLGCATFISLSSSRTPNSTPAVPQSAGQPAAPPVAQMPGLPAPDAEQAMPAPMPEPMANIGPMPAPEQMTVAVPHGPAPVLVFDGGAPPAAAPGAAGAADNSDTPAMLGGGSTVSANDQPDSAAAKSTRMADPANTVVQGTLIPAVLETAINSDLPGYARAVVSQDVRSFDGRKILIPRSSRLIGEYKTGLAQGQKRAYLLWTRLVRPDGVSIALASPAIDFSGQAGVTGQVNTHFFQRFGSALLLSVLGGAGSLIGGGSTVVVSGGQNAASAAAQADLQRPPTIRVRPGEPVRVFTARDLIFTPAGASRG